MKLLLVVTLAAASGCVVWKSSLEEKESELSACQKDAADQKSALDAKIASLEKAKRAVEKQLDEATALAEKEQLELQAEGKRSAELATEKGSLAENMQKLQGQLAELQRQEQAERDRAALFQKLVAQLKGMIDAGKLQVVIRNGKMVVKLPDNVLFDPGRTDVKAAGRDALSQLTDVLKAIPDRNFQVCGYTDDTPIRTARFPSNWVLSTARAVEVVNLMIKDGMEPQRLSAAGYGEYDPISPNDTVEGKAQNRRIEVAVMPNLAELPRFDEGAPATAAAAPSGNK
ncbi:MAG: OmpA/MotB family protein [Deltaproteobacteria bacterium]